MWAKRLATAPALVAALRRVSKLRHHGARIDLPAFVAPCVWNGKISNLEIGKGTFVGRAEVHLHDRICIGKYVTINDGARLLTASHSLDDPDFHLLKGPIVIGDYAWIAMGAMLLPGVTVGKGSVVGAGAVVARNIPDYSVVVGNPARTLTKTRTTNLRYEPLRGLASIEAWLGRNAEPSEPQVES